MNTFTCSRSARRWLFLLISITCGTISTLRGAEYSELSDGQDNCACDCNCQCDMMCDRLLGIVAPTDPCFLDFISPMTNPVFFEDPRT